MQVKTEEFKVEKNTRYGVVMKPTGLERVFVFNESESKWVQCGYVHIAQNCMTGLVDLEPDLGELIAAEISAQKGFAITYGGAAQSYAPQQQEEDDELIGEAEE